MTPFEIAAQFDDRTGYSVVGYGEVGLPVFAISAIGLVQQQKSLNAVEEFVLRAIRTGLCTQDEIARFLGLQVEIVSRSLVDLIHQGLVSTSLDAVGRMFALTKTGETAAVESQITRPQETMLAFTYDGLIRTPKYYDTADLIAPRFLPDMGLSEIPAMPNRGPLESELNVLDVERVISSGDRGNSLDGKLLKVKRVERRARVFLPAVSITYKDDLSGAYRIAFAIGGRISEEHELAFARAKGLERVTMFANLAAPTDQPALEDVLGVKLASGLPSVAQSLGIARETARARAKLDVARIRAQGASTALDRGKSDTEVKVAEEKLTQSEQALKAYSVRPLPVYEHPPLLAQALQDAKSRLMIISPWIRRAVVDRDFIKLLTALLERGVQVHIGYGIGEEDRGAREDDRKAESQLLEFAQKHKNFVFRRLGDTHAKVLVKDQEFLVISSFNWLSFRGDSNRTFREEWGTYIGIPEKIDEFYQNMLTRFSQAISREP